MIQSLNKKLGKKIIQWAGLIIGMCIVNACVSTYTALQKIPLGANQVLVRKQLGRPVSVGRLQGYTTWVYRFKWNAQEYSQTLFFEDGRVQKVGPLLPYPNYQQKMTESESWDEYETNAMLYHRQKESAFRQINSVKKPKKTTNPQVPTKE